MQQDPRQRLRTSRQPTRAWFCGTVSSSWISVARLADAAGRNSFVPWLEGRLEPSQDGGTSVAVRVGPQAAATTMLAVLAVVTALISPGALAGGLYQVSTGHLSGALPAVLVPPGLLA